ncbi:MAG: xanthine dehydrogenase family protein molybdopterin-binding subunit [Solirubrobacterales bacterium]
MNEDRNGAAGTAARAEAGDAGRPYTGSRVRRQDGDRFLRGRVSYTDDIALPGTAHLALVRSDVAHGRIVAVEAEAARREPGVITVLDGAELAESFGPIPLAVDPAGIGGQPIEMRCLPTEKVVYHGQPVAAVVAETRAQALDAAAAVELRTEALPVVLDAEAALADDAPLLYEAWGTNLLLGGTVGDGDVEAALAGCEHLLEGEVRTGRQSPAPMEPRAYIASWDGRAERLTWYGTTQAPHPLRHSIATFMGLRERQVHVVAPPVGGSFGYKNFGHPEEYLVCALTRLLGRPVKFAEDRAATLRYGSKDMRLRFRAGCDAEGRVRGVACELLADHGAAAATGAFAMAFAGALALPNGYDVPAFQVDYRVAVTNKGPWSPFRPFGKEAASLVMERIMDRVAEATGEDPAEVRRRNWVAADRFPFETATGLQLDSGDYGGLLDKVLERLDYAALRERQDRARAAGRCLGVGFGFEVLPEGADIPGALIGASDTSTVRMDPSGEVTILTGVTSPGNGNDTAICQIVADRLGLPLEAIDIVQGDTDLCPFGFGNVSSRGVLAGGASAAAAADDVAAKLRQVAARMLEAGEGEAIELGGGMAAVAGQPERALPIGAVAHAVYTLGYAIAPDVEPALESTRTFKMPNIRHRPDEKGRIAPFSTFSNALYACLVEVDRETGAVAVLRHVMAHDCGVMINPGFVAGQFTGGVATGLGAALGEEAVYAEDGRLATDAFKTYLLPRANELPPFELLHQVTPSPFTPLGTKGAGEGGVACSMASVLNAVNDALRPLGATVERLPITPQRVLAAIEGATA